MKVTYEIENGKKVKVETFFNGSVYKYDENGNIIYHKSSDGNEYWHEYDSNGNEIHFKDNHGDEEWREYDANGKLIHYKDTKGREWKQDSLQGQ